MIAPCLYIAETPQMGRGVFTSQKIAKGSVVEIAPVLVMNDKERLLIDQTQLYNYIFEWGEKSDECCVAFGWISIYNHSYTSNCIYDMDYDAQTITIKTVKTIEAGEELFINYNGECDNKKKLWFDAV